MNKQVIHAVYKVYSTFVIPEGIDLDDKEQVSKWWIKWDTMYIEMVDGREFKVRPYIIAGDSNDYKRPDDTMLNEEEVDEDYKDEDYVLKTD